MFGSWMQGLVFAVSLLAAAPAVTQPTSPMTTVEEVIAGRNTVRSIPKEPVAIVYMFHGSGGSEAFATRLHSRRILEKLSARGYGFAASASADRDPPEQWDNRSIDPGSNADVAYMLELHSALIRRGEIGPGTPVFTTGMSNGGGFANLFAVAAKAKGLPVRGVADYMGPIPAPSREAAGKTYPPLFVVVSENDGLVSAETVTGLAHRLSEAGTSVELHLTREKVVTAETFKVIPGMSQADRKKTLQALMNGGVLDVGGHRLVFKNKTKIDRPEMAELASMMPPGPAARDVMNELLIAWAGHQMRSDLADDQVRFFDKALGR